MFLSRTMPMITKKWRHIPLNHWLSNSLRRKAFFLWIIINRWLANNYDLFNYGSEPAQWRCKDKTIKLTLKNFFLPPLSLSLFVIAEPNNKTRRRQPFYGRKWAKTPTGGCLTPNSILVLAYQEATPAPDAKSWTWPWRAQRVCSIFHMLITCALRKPM